MTGYSYHLQPRKVMKVLVSIDAHVQQFMLLIFHLTGRWQHHPDSHEKIEKGTKSQSVRWQYLLDVSENRNAY